MNDCPVRDDLDPAVSAARRELAKSGYTWLARVEVAVAAGRVVLRGDVPSYYLKQLAQVTVLSVPGVPGVRNELRVSRGT
ncbi:MAG: BON domain-containing protein [Gemmataceae bacterium]